MPNTSNYNFEYESPTSLPGTTLTGGQGGGSPVLAQQVDTVIGSLETTITGFTAQLNTLQTRIETLEALRPLSGTVSVTPNTQIVSGFFNSNYWRGTTAIVFPVGYFSVTPTVVATAITTVPGTTIEVGVSDTTAAGFNVYIARANTTDTSVYWVATHNT